MRLLLTDDDGTLIARWEIKERVILARIGKGAERAGNLRANRALIDYINTIASHLTDEVIAGLVRWQKERRRAPKGEPSC